MVTNTNNKQKIPSSNKTVQKIYRVEGSAYSGMACHFSHAIQKQLKVHQSYHYQGKRCGSKCSCLDEAAPSWMQEPRCKRCQENLATAEVSEDDIAVQNLKGIL